MQLTRHLAGGEPHVGRLAQCTHAGVVGAVQRFLHPVDREPLELARDRERILEAPGRLCVPRHPPTLVAVDQELETGADARAHRLERADVVAPVAAMEAQLQGGEALRQEALGGVRLGLRVAQRAGGGVGAHTVRESPEQLPARLTEDLAREVPEREVERPAAAVVKVDVREHPEMALERERILPDEETLVPLETEHAIARADAHQPGVGRYPYQRRIEVHPRLRVPAGVEGRRERQAVMTDGDRGDLVSGGRRRARGTCAHEGENTASLAAEPSTVARPPEAEKFTTCSEKRHWSREGPWRDAWL